MRPSHVRAAALSLLAFLSVASSPASQSSHCSSQKCSAEASRQRSGHYALLQVRGRLSSSWVSREDTAEHAESLVEAPVFPDSDLTDFEKDYIEDSSNPLDVGEKEAAAHDAAFASGKTGEAGGSSTRCCEGKTAKCEACKARVTVQDFCMLHGDVKGCEKAFDCDAGLDNWKLGWSDLKKLWCCTYQQKGCAKTDGVASGSENGTQMHKASGGTWADDYVNDANAANVSTEQEEEEPVVHMNGSDSSKCVTREDPRATAFGYTTSEPGTKCIFGLPLHHGRSPVRVLRLVLDHADHGVVGELLRVLPPLRPQQGHPPGGRSLGEEARQRARHHHNHHHHGRAEHHGRTEHHCRTVDHCQGQAPQEEAAQACYQHRATIPHGCAQLDQFNQLCRLNQRRRNRRDDCDHDHGGSWHRRDDCDHNHEGGHGRRRSRRKGRRSRS